MIKKILEEVTEVMKPNPVYAVGGCVRDHILGIEPKDYDFCTPAEPDEIERLIRADKMRAYLTGKRFGTLGCKVKVDGKYHMVEITTFRKEEYKPKDRKPKVEYVETIREDLSRRDFTINALAMKLEGGKIKIIDPFNGRQDIKNKLIKCVGIPKHRFKEDPLRMLRAIRFAARFNFCIDTLTHKKIRSGAITILDISKERWMMELDKILMSDNVGEGLMLLWADNLFKYMIPELDLQHFYDQNSRYHSNDLDYHTMKVVCATPKDINLRWAALLHDIGKPFVRTDKVVEVGTGTGAGKKISKSNYIGHEILGAEIVDRLATYLKWSNKRRKAVVDLVRNHLEDNSPLRKYDNEGKK